MYMCKCKCKCKCKCMCMCIGLNMYVYAHMYMFMTFHNGFMFCASSLQFFKYIYIYTRHHESSRKPQHSKWNCVGTNRPRHIHMNTPKIRIVQKKIPRRRKSNSNLLINSKNHPKSFEFIWTRIVLPRRGRARAAPFWTVADAKITTASFRASSSLNLRPSLFLLDGTLVVQRLAVCISVPLSMWRSRVPMER